MRSARVGEHISRHNNYLFVWRHFKETLPLANNDTITIDEYLINRTRKRRIDFVEHLHDLNNIQRVPSIKMVSLLHVKWQIGRFTSVEHTATHGNDLIGLGGRRWCQCFGHRRLMVA